MINNKIFIRIAAKAIKEIVNKYWLEFNHSK